MRSDWKRSIPEQLLFKFVLFNWHFYWRKFPALCEPSVGRATSPTLYFLSIIWEKLLLPVGINVSGIPCFLECKSHLTWVQVISGKNKATSMNIFHAETKLVSNYKFIQLWLSCFWPIISFLCNLCHDDTFLFTRNSFFHSVKCFYWAYFFNLLSLFGDVQYNRSQSF